MQTKSLYIGVMSGTSLDGIDTALVSINSDRTELIASDTFSIPKHIKQNVLDIAMGQKTNLVEVGLIDSQLGHLYADAVNQLLAKNNIHASAISAIGNHGQTVYHQPSGNFPFTIQLGDANIIAAKTGITTVADFRRKDVALGGQGAPLVPAFHRMIFNPSNSSIVVLNIGGIANISVLRANTATLGYDTGPGNMLLDAWINTQTGENYDKDGQFSSTGKVIPELLNTLCNDDYFQLEAPKSTGRELFNLDWLHKKLNELKTTITPQNVQATLSEFTALTIANEVIKYQQGDAPELLVCGGGSRNPRLMARLTTLLPNWHVCTTDEKGVNSEYMEAIAFAWLAYRRCNNLPSNLPEVTGASRPASLGVIYPAD